MAVEVARYAKGVSLDLDSTTPLAHLVCLHHANRPFTALPSTALEATQHWYGTGTEEWHFSLQIEGRIRDQIPVLSLNA